MPERGTRKKDKMLFLHYNELMITSNQKDILFQEISPYLQTYNVQSLLDIGAGDGVLAKKLAQRVPKYLAIEQDKRRVDTLKNLDLNVIHSIFPQHIPEKFDMVLASHSTPESEKLIGSFLRNAWEHLNDGGILLIITFKGERGELHNLRKEWVKDEYSKDADEILYHTLLGTLNTYGTVQVHRAVSYFSSDNIDEITKLVLDSIGPQKSKYDLCERFLREYIKKNHYTENIYSFPYEHVFFVAQK